MITPYFLENFWVGSVFLFTVFTPVLILNILAVFPPYHVHVSQKLSSIDVSEIVV